MNWEWPGVMALQIKVVDMKRLPKSLQHVTSGVMLSAVSGHERWRTMAVHGFMDTEANVYLTRIKLDKIPAGERYSWSGTNEFVTTFWVNFAHSTSRLVNMRVEHVRSATRNEVLVDLRNIGSAGELWETIITDIDARLTVI